MTHKSDFEHRLSVSGLKNVWAAMIYRYKNHNLFPSLIHRIEKASQTHKNINRNFKGNGRFGVPHTQKQIYERQAGPSPNSF